MKLKFDEAQELGANNATLQTLVSQWEKAYNRLTVSQQSLYALSNAETPEM